MRLITSHSISVPGAVITLTAPTMRVARRSPATILAGPAETSYEAERPRVTWRVRPDAGSIQDWLGALTLETWDAQGGAQIATTRDVTGLLYWSDGILEVDLWQQAVSRATLTLTQYAGAATRILAQVCALDAERDVGDPTELGSKTTTANRVQRIDLALAVPQPADILIANGRAFTASALIVAAPGPAITAVEVYRSGLVVHRLAPVAIPGGTTAMINSQGLSDLWGIALGGGPSTADMALNARSA